MHVPDRASTHLTDELPHRGRKRPLPPPHGALSPAAEALSVSGNGAKNAGRRHIQPRGADGLDSEHCITSPMQSPLLNRPSQSDITRSHRVRGDGGGAPRPARRHLGLGDRGGRQRRPRQ